MDGLTLQIEAMSEKDLLAEHMRYIRECMEYDIWQDITDTHCYQMRERLGNELRIRMGAE
jgi:hypothetical protein